MHHIKKVNKCKLRFEIKLWITPALQKSVSGKNYLLKKVVNCDDSQIKLNETTLINTQKGVKSILRVKLTRQLFRKFKLKMIAILQT